MNPDPPEDGENEGDDELIFDQTAFAAAGGASEEQVGRKRLGMVLLVCFDASTVKKAFCCSGCRLYD